MGIGKQQRRNIPLGEMQRDVVSLSTYWPAKPWLSDYILSFTYCTGLQKYTFLSKGQNNKYKFCIFLENNFRTQVQRSHHTIMKR